MWDNRRIANHSLITKYKWRTSDMRFAFAFLETMTERDGTNLIAIMRGAIMHDDALAAEWAHGRLPALTGNSARYQTAAYPGFLSTRTRRSESFESHEQTTASISHGTLGPC